MDGSKKPLVIGRLFGFDGQAEWLEDFLDIALLYGIVAK